jgi:hypothetical protein
MIFVYNDTIFRSLWWRYNQVLLYFCCTRNCSLHLSSAGESLIGSATSRQPRKSVRMRCTGAPDHKEQKPGILKLRTSYARRWNWVRLEANRGGQEETGWTFIGFAHFPWHAFHWLSLTSHNNGISIAQAIQSQTIPLLRLLNWKVYGRKLPWRISLYYQSMTGELRKITKISWDDPFLRTHYRSTNNTWKRIFSENFPMQHRHKFRVAS